MQYSQMFKDKMIRRMTGTNAISAGALSREVDVAQSTLSTWLREAGNSSNNKEIKLKTSPRKKRRPQDLSPEEKFKLIVEAEKLDPVELGAFLRKKGLHETHLEQWRIQMLESFHKGPSKPSKIKSKTGDVKKIKALEKKLRRKDKALAETAALLVLKKKSPSNLGGRGRRHNQEERRLILALVNEAVANGAQLKRAAKTIGPMREPANKLTLQEKQQIIDVATSKDFCDLSPKQIVPLLADRREYIASETTFYRGLREHDMVHHREPSKPANQARPKELVATGPCQVWSWDITYMPSPARGMFFYLYMVIDVWSRKIIAARVHESESMELSARLIRQSCMACGIQPDTLVLHSDNGGPMKGITMLATLQQLGVMPSFSRPGVSDDNPYSESLFRTMKYRPGYPVKPFESLEHAQKWVDDFTAWYNTEHLHSAIRYVTPDDRHYGRQEAILAARNEVYLQAKNRTPERWPIKTRNWEPIGEVKLNPAKAKKPLEKGCDKLAA